MVLLGNSIKDIAESTLLYDSTKTGKTTNSFASIDAKGSSLSYSISAITSIATGFLFVFNPYLPLILSTLTSLLTIVLAYRFEEVETQKQNVASIKKLFYDTKQGFVFILHSKRLRAFFLFISIFVGILMMLSTYEKSLLIDLQIPSEYFGIIFAFMTLVQCIAVPYQAKLHHSFKNRTLTFLSIPIFFSFILIGIVSSLTTNTSLILVTALIAFSIQHFLRSPYWVLQNKYLTNFTTADIRAKVFSACGFVEGIGRMIVMFLGGLLLEYYSTSQAYFILGVFGFIVILLVLAYMKKRFGLQPEEYEKKDIEYEK